MRTIIILISVCALFLSCKKQSNNSGGSSGGNTNNNTSTSSTRYADIEFSLSTGDSTRHWVGKYYINGVLKQTMGGSGLNNGCMFSDGTTCASHQNAGMNSYGAFSVNIGDVISATIYEPDSVAYSQDAVIITFYATNPAYISSSNTKGLVIVKTTPNYINCNSTTLTYTVK